MAKQQSREYPLLRILTEPGRDWYSRRLCGVPNCRSRASSHSCASTKYFSRSISGAIARYAPPIENDTKNYERLVARLTGLDITRKLSELDASELALVISAIQTIEGFKVGTETIVRKVVSAISEDDRLVAFFVQGNSNPLPLRDAIAQALSGELDAVVVRMRSGRVYLRARPDAESSNNFESLIRQSGES